VPDFTLPELGENVTSGEVLRVLVKAGDTLAEDQPVIELETDKATVEVPSSVTGRITEVKVKAGDTVKVGQAILSVEDARAGAPTEEKSSQKPAEKAARKAKEMPAEQADKKSPQQSEEKPAATSQETSTGKPPQKAPEPEAGEAVAANTGEKIPEDGGLEQHVAGAKRSTSDKSGVKAATTEGTSQTENTGRATARPQKVVDISRGARTSAEPAARRDLPPAPAAPSVRRVARELGVDVNEIAGTGPNGRISIEDVKAHTKRLVEGPRRTDGAAATPLPDFSRWGEIDRQPMRGVRRATAAHVTAAWTTIPHVTQHHAADITRLEELRKRYAKEAEDAGGALTITAIAIKVCAAALKVFPQFNSAVDLAAEEIIFKKYVNIGVAVDTDRGLLVPVVKNGDAKNIIELSVELSQLSEKARSRKITLDEMQGGCFSISNLGGIGGTYFTPIINAPEVAILGISRARIEPVWKESERGVPAGGEFVPRLMLPLSLSYDHRVIDGADGIRFLRWVAEALEQPFLLALEG